MFPNRSICAPPKNPTSTSPRWSRQPSTSRSVPAKVGLVRVTTGSRRRLIAPDLLGVVVVVAIGRCRVRAPGLPDDRAYVRKRDGRSFRVVSDLVGIEDLFACDNRMLRGSDH